MIYSVKKFVKHITLIITLFLLTMTPAFAGDNSDSILKAMIILLAVSSVLIVGGIVISIKKKKNK